VAFAEPTIVVNLVGEAEHGLLAESRFVERSFLPGGEHNLYELAFAATQAGFRVELRGWLDRAAFDAFRTALGVSPNVELPARPATSGDIVVVPEGWRDPVEYARLLLSPARVAMFILAPPGLFGWPFGSPGNWAPPDPATVPLDAVATPEQFQAIRDLAIFMITHSPGIVAAAQAAGVPCHLVGTGRPYALNRISEGTNRPTDVAALLANRWAPLVRTVAAQLSGQRLDLIDEVGNREVIERLSRSRVLLWPSRIEGHATIPWEARSVGCVPVALSTNRFAVGLSDETGAVIVDTVEELAGAINDLLVDEERWSELSARAQDHARRESDWSAYVARVRDALLAIPPANRAKPALAGMGAALHARAVQGNDRWQERLEELEAERLRLIADRDQLASELERVVAHRDRLAAYIAELERWPEVRVASKARALARRRSS
jgi:hypothetical protein